MADYTAPFHMPKFSDEKFLAKKAEYVKKYGYAITIPRFDEIVHLGMHKPMTPQEKILWYSGKRGEIGRSRQLELLYQKERAKERYHKMLASPIPNVLSSITSVLSAIDDAQDAIISLAAIGRIACFFLPRFIAAFLAWPIGLLWLIATIMGLLIAPSACFLNPIACKRYIRLKMAMRKDTLKGKSRSVGKRVKAASKYELARLKAGFRGYATSGSFMPSFSEAIQMLQVTDNIWGVGLSIGPVFGLAYDLMSGGVRWARGERVVFKSAPTDVEIYNKAADKYHTYARWKRPKTKMSRAEFLDWKEKKIAEGTWGVRSKQDKYVLQAQRIHQTGYALPRRTNWVEETLLYTNAEISGQGLQNVLNVWDPVVEVEGLEHIEIEGYNEPNPLVEAVLLEEGVDPAERIGWPSLGKRWASYEELQTSTAPVAANNIDHFSKFCPDENLRAISEMSATACGLQSIATMIGPEWLEIQYHACIDIAETLLDKRYAFPRSINERQIIDFALWTQAHEDNNTRPNLFEILSYAKNNLGFEFATR